MITEELIEKTLEFEGGYVNNPNDPGGETKYGISKRQYPSVDIKSLTVADAIEIYKRDYFLRLNLDDVVNPEVAWKLFDIAVNQGVGTSTRFAQQILHQKEDGILGKDTVVAINSYAEKQILRYADIVIKNPSKAEFLKGWIKRGLEY